MGIIAVSNLARSANATPPSGATFDHAVIIIMEDHGIQDICAGSPPPCSSTNGDPYTAGLANSYSIGSQYLGVSHYSQTDYLALLGGDTFGCSGTSCPWPFNAPNLVDRFEAAGLTWKGYMENQNGASGCDSTYHEPYTPEHNPFVGFTDIVDSPARCANVVLANPSSCTVTDCVLVNDLNSVSAPSFMWLTPNNCDNMHGFTGICSTSIPMGDNYLSGLVPNILKSYTFTNTRAALFVVFDEGTGWCPLNGSSEDCVYATWVGPLTKTGFVTSNLYNHYSWTKTIETNWNLASLTSNDAKATPMTEFFKTAAPPVLSTSFTYSPSSPQVGQQITFTASASGGTAPYTFSWNFGDGTSGTGITTTHTYSATGRFTVVLTTKDSGSPQQTATSQQSVTVINPPPPPLTASFTYSPTSPQVSQQVTFTGSASGGQAPYSFAWSFGDGLTGTGSSATHSYSSAGTFTIILTVKDRSSPQQTATTQQSISVAGSPPPLTASFSYSPSNPATGQSISFTGSASGGTQPYGFSWNFGDGSTGTGSTASHQYSASGSYTVTLTAKDNGSPQQTATSQQSITVSSPSPSLTVNFSYSPSSPQTSQQVSFTGSASGGMAPYTYSWSFGDGSTGSGGSTTHAYSSAGTYSVVLTVTDSGSPQQTATSQHSITVTGPPPALTASFTYSPSSPQTGQQTSFTASSNGGTAPYTFSWNFGDGSTATGSSATHTYQSTGTFTVVLTVKDTGSPQQTTTTQQSITVTSPPPPLATSFTYSPSSPQTGQQVSFAASASGGTSPYSFSWNFGDGSSGVGNSATHSYQTAGKYTVTLIATDASGQKATTTQTITITSPPPPLSAGFSYSPSSPEAGRTVSFTSSVSGGTPSYSYSWIFGDGSTGSGSSPTHTYSSAGTFTVTLTVTDAVGLIAKSSQTITVSSALQASFTYSPSNPLPLQAVSFTASATGGTGPYTYSWDFGDGSTSSGSTTSHSYLLPGSYTVKLTVTDANGYTVTISQTITVLTSL